MATFVKSNYAESVSTLISDANERVVTNNHYMYNNLKPINLTFYNIDKTGSTWDTGTITEFAVLGKESPFRYNKIKNATLYGQDLRVLFSMDYGENGLETTPVEFELVVIPNTFEPYPNSFIIFDQLEQNPKTKGYLFIVDEVVIDTFENDANSYRIRCHLYSTHGRDYESLERQVVRTFVMNIDNSGTDMKCVMTEEDNQIASTLDTVIGDIIDFYKGLFWNNSLQTFTYSTAMGFYYDPYLIEFLIRNKVFNGFGSDYIHIHHELPMPKTFAIDYMESVFRAIEMQDLKAFTDRQAYGQMIDNVNTLFATVPQTYYAVIYDKSCMFGLFQPIPSVMVASAQEGCHYILQEEYSMYNPITSYFNEEELDSNTIDVLQKIKFKANKDFFYYIPILVYVLKYYLNRITKTS